MQGLIPVAGSGTRLGPFTDAVPTELLPVGDKAEIEHVLEMMRLADINDIVIVVSPHKHGLSGEPAIDGSFVVVLGDSFFRSKEFLKELISYHLNERTDATIGVAEVVDVTRHSIIKTEEDRIMEIIEKPSMEAAPSTIGDIGAYDFDSFIFDAIRETEPGYNGELQLTDSVKAAINKGRRVLYKKIDGIHIDVGTPADPMLETSGT